VLDVWGDVQERMNRVLQKHDPMITVETPGQPDPTNGAVASPKKTK